MTDANHATTAAIGIFGGTFDPVHYGHLRAALEVKEILQLDDLRLLPAGTPPHRSAPVADSSQRLAMLRLAVAEYPGFTIDEREVRREGNSYMVDTLREIRGEAGNAPIMLFIGQDAANGLDSWHEWRNLYKLAHLVIMRRPDSEMTWSGELLLEMKKRLVDTASELHTQAADLVLSLEITQLAISSTGIRQQLLEGRSPRFLLPGAVIDYIQQNRLYFAGTARKG